MKRLVLASLLVACAPRPLHTSEKACTLRSARWVSRPAPSLSLRPGSPPFATVYAAPRDVALTFAASGPRLDLTAGPVRIGGFVEPSTVKVFPQMPFDLDGVIFPNATTELTAERRDAARVKVSFPKPHGIETNLPFEFNVPCATIGIDHGAFNALSVVGVSRSSRTALLRAGRRVGVSARVDSAPVLWIDVGAHDHAAVYVRATYGDRSEIAYPTGSVTMHGWVSNDDLVEGDAEPLPAISIGSDEDYFGWPAPSRSVHCTREIELFVSQGSERAQVGLVSAGATLGVLADGASFTSVIVSDSGVLPLENAALLVRTSDVDACRRGD